MIGPCVSVHAFKIQAWDETPVSILRPPSLHPISRKPGSLEKGKSLTKLKSDLLSMAQLARKSASLFRSLGRHLTTFSVGDLGPQLKSTSARDTRFAIESETLDTLKLGTESPLRISARTWLSVMVSRVRGPAQ